MSQTFATSLLIIASRQKCGNGVAACEVLISWMVTYTKTNISLPIEMEVSCTIILQANPKEYIWVI